MPPYWVFRPRTAGLFWTPTPIFLRWGVFSISSRTIGRSSLHTESSPFLDGIVLHAWRCWRRWSCVPIFGRTYGEPSSPCVRTIVHSYRLGAQHPNADGLSRQCGQCLRPGYLISSPELHARDAESSSELLDQRFASSEMGDSMNADLLPELSGEKWVTVTYLEEVTADVPPADSEPDFIVASWLDDHSTPMGSVWIGTPLVGLFGITELRCWRLQFGDLSMDTDGQEV